MTLVYLIYYVFGGTLLLFLLPNITQMNVNSRNFAIHIVNQVHSHTFDSASVKLRYKRKLHETKKVYTFTLIKK